MFCLNLVGLSLGPFFVGFVSDLLKSGFDDRSLPIALSILTATSFWSAYHFWLCGRALNAAET
jgi:hypothetical protein